jgi:hypothetical protein
MEGIANFYIAICPIVEVFEEMYYILCNTNFSAYIQPLTIHKVVFGEKGAASRSSPVTPLSAHT